MTRIQLTVGETKVVNMPSHTLDKVGYASFVVDGLDFDQYTQWSVIGARKSEIIKENENIGKLGDDCCRVYVLDDQYTPKDESRIINVSVIGTDATTKQQVEAKAILTVDIHPQAAIEDFHISAVSFPDVILFDPKTKETIPSPILGTVTINQELGEALYTKFKAQATISVQGDYNIPETHNMTPTGDHSKVFSLDMTKAFHDIVDYQNKPWDFLEGSVDFELYRFGAVGELDYYHTVGKEFLVHRINK